MLSPELDTVINSQMKCQVEASVLFCFLVYVDQPSKAEQSYFRAHFISLLFLPY